MKKVFIKSLQTYVDATEENRTLLRFHGLEGEIETQEKTQDHAFNSQEPIKPATANSVGADDIDQPVVQVRVRKRAGEKGQGGNAGKSELTH